ncbi:MAG: TlpA family protein disulfide reductase [Thermoanaerobaculia bacterium]
MRSVWLGVGLLVCAGAVALAQDGRNLPFPDIELAEAEGSAVRLSQLKGNVIFLNFWATWCGPCRMELPIVQRLYDRYSDRNFVVLAVNLDADRRKIEPFLKRYNISLPVYFAAPEDAGQMTQMGIPSTFIVGPDRTLIDQFVGYSAAAEERWKQLIEKHLKARKPTR